jgi:hypothetical protein
VDGSVVHFWPNGSVRRKEVWEANECILAHDYDEEGSPAAGASP